MADYDGLTIRRSDAKDAKALAKLVHAQEWFSEASVASQQSADVADKFIRDLLPGSLLCVTVEDAQGDVVAFASFDDRPAQGFSKAEDAVAALQISGVETSNLIFLTCWGAADGVSAASFDLVMRALFDTMPRTDFVMLMCHPKSRHKDLYNDLYFDDIGAYCDPAATESLNETPWLVMCCRRTSWRLNLDTRPAQVEDYDDLVKIFDSQSQVLTKTFGEFFLAELIEAQDENNRAVAATLRGRAVGMMCLTTQIDVSLLQNNFELEAFDNLVPSSEITSESDIMESKFAEEKAAGNVFAISVFCISEEHRSRTRDVLISAFESFPGREYCVLTLPSEVYESALLPYFTVIAPREGSTLSHSLYLLHRDALRVLKAGDFSIGEESKFSEEKLSEPRPRWVGGSQLTVRRSDHSDEDLAAIVDLLDGLDTLDDVQAQVVNKGNSTLLVEVLGQLIGLVVICPEVSKDDLIKLGHKFHMETVQGVPSIAAMRESLKFGVVLQVSLLPIFNQFARLILQEVMRLTALDGLVYKLFPGDLPPVAVVQEMAPIRPRRTFHLQRAMKLRHIHEAPEKDTRFSLFMLSRAALSEPRLTLNARIVVIGASTAGLSVLEELLTLPHAYFPKLTLVAPGGVADERFDGVRSLCTQGTSAPGGYDSRLLDRLGLRDRITIVEDRMLFIERDPQAVVLADGSLLPYDFLVLATGLQDTTLHRLCDIKHSDLVESKSLAESAYSIGGNPREAVMLRRAIENKHAKIKSPTIVYGDTLEAYAAVQALMTWGLPGPCITLVQPPARSDSTDQTFARDVWVSERVTKDIKDAGVQILSGYKLTGVTRDPGTGAVSQATFLKAADPSNDISGGENSAGPSANSEESKESSHEDNYQEYDDLDYNGEEKAEQSKPLVSHSSTEEDLLEQINCRLLIAADRRNVDPDVFASVNDTGLVYDGRMVVNSSFQTIDPRILGCGTNTKFSRRYRAPLVMEHHSSREVGARVAASLLSFVDPLQQPEQNGGSYNLTDSLSDSLPAWSMPNILAHNVELPGQVTYFHACTPGWDGSERHTVYETKTEDNFCRLEITFAGFIASVSYAFTDDVVRAKATKLGLEANLSESRMRALKNRVTPVDQLVGLHISYLNGIEEQLSQGRVTDLLDFLSQDWASALYHDRFGSFCRDLQGLFASSSDVSLQDVVTKLTDAYGAENAEDLDIAVARGQLVGHSGQCLPGLTKKSIQARVVSFLHDNADLLDMYALPALRRSASAANKK